jgi:hypothetical protein
MSTVSSLSRVSNVPWLRPVVDRRRELLKNLVAQQRPQDCLVAFAKAATTISKAVRPPWMKCEGSKFGSAPRIALSPRQQHRPEASSAGLTERLSGQQRCHVVGGRAARRGNSSRGAVSRPAAENTAQPEHQNPATIANKMMSVLLKPAHVFRGPSPSVKRRDPALSPTSFRWAPVPPRLPTGAGDMRPRPGAASISAFGESAVVRGSE